MFKKILSLLALLGLTHPASSEEKMKADTPIPAVTVMNQDNKAINLAEQNTGWVLVYFYPKADTPGCTKQACSLRDSYEKIQAEKAKVFGVSFHDVASQKKFQEKFKLPFDLLADTEGKIADAFGVPHVGKFAKRQAFLFKDGKLVWKDESASTDQQAADMLKAMGKSN